MTPETYIVTVLPKMEGWCTPEKARRIVELVQDNKAEIYVEIGVFAGRSLFAAALTQIQCFVNPVAVGIDPWSAHESTSGFNDENAKWWGKLDHDAIYNKCRMSLSSLGLTPICYLLRCSSLEAVRLVLRLSPIDILHIDGNHSEESSCRDVENYEPLVRPGGIILFDDTDWSHTKRAQTILSERAELLTPVGACGVYRKHGGLPTSMQKPTVPSNGGA